MKVELRAQAYQIDREPDELVQINVRFVLMTPPNRYQEVAEALKRIELFMADKVNIVKSDGSARCFYCGTKQADDAQTCTQCGAPL